MNDSEQQLAYSVSRPSNDLQDRGESPAPSLEPLDPARAAHATVPDGTTIYFETFAPDDAGRSDSSQQPTDPGIVLLIMGLGASARLWAPVARRLLALGYEVITFDNRGSGRSSTPRRPWTTAAMADDAVAVLDELDISTVHVGGASLGGMVAQELALRAHHRVSSLVLGATTGGFRWQDLATRQGLPHLLATAVRSLRSEREPEQRIRTFLRTTVSEDYARQSGPGDEIWDTVAAMLEDPVSRSGFAKQLLAAARHSSWSRLHRLRVPVLVHHGSNDPMVPVSGARELARRIPGARLKIHEGGGHALLDRADDVGDMLGDFLAELATAPRRGQPGAAV